MPFFPNIELAHPEYLWLLVIIPILITYYIFRYNYHTAAIAMPSPWKASEIPKATFLIFLRHFLFGLRILVIALLILIFARPQSMLSWKNITSEGIDIVIAQDISGSMLSKDFSPNRLEAAKKLAIEFIDGRPQDKIGLVVFSSQAFTQCPLTTDHSQIKNLFEQVHTGMIEDGTAIGDGLATAVNRLKEDSVKSKVIILLTDGVNNRQTISPETAAEIAKVFGIRVYTIGVGTNGKAESPVGINPGGQVIYAMADVEIDETLLKYIASETGGKYFRATDNESMKKIYSEIDKMEKSKIREKHYSDRTEEYLPLALLAGILLLIELALRNTVLKTIS